MPWYSLACSALLAPQSPGALGPLHIEGLVVGRDRLPVPNCEVWVGDDPSARGHTRTDGSGCFQLTTERRQYVPVHARLAGVGIGAAWVDGSHDEKQPARVQLLPCRALQGVVRTADGAPVAGAFVTAAPFDLVDLSLAFAATRTDAQGNYRLLEVVLGPVSVRATKPGHAAVMVDDDGRSPRLDLELDPDECRSLTVALAGADAAQLERASVRLFAEREAFPVPLPPELTRVRFDAAGRCRCDGLPSRARIHIEVDVPGAAVPSLDDFMPSEVQHWESKLVLVAQAPPLRGRLVDKSGAGQGGIPVAAVAAAAAWQMQRPSVAITAPDGSFELRAPAALGQPVALAVLDDAWLLAPPEGSAMSPFVVIHDPKTRHEIAVRPTLRIAARVVDAQGRGVVGVGTAAIDDGQALFATDLDGRLRIIDRSGLPKAVIGISIAEAVGGGTWQFAITGSEQDLGTLPVTAGGSIRGRALDDKGEPVAGARIWVNCFGSPMLQILQIADANGGYEFVGLPPASYGLRAARVGDQASAIGLEVCAGDELRRDLLVR